jgi:hypothetical protein
LNFTLPTTSVTHLLEKKEKHAEGEDPETRTGTNRKYELCRTAANHVASLGGFSASDNHTTDFLSLAAFYQKTYLLERSPPLIIYYLFSSSILLDFDGAFILFYFAFARDLYLTPNVVAMNPSDPHAHSGFTKCVNGLRSMGVTWPSAGRALVLFTGAKTGSPDTSMVELTQSSTVGERHKRTAEHDLDDSSYGYSASPNSTPASNPAQPLEYGHVSKTGNIRSQYPQQPPHLRRTVSLEAYFTDRRGYTPDPSASAWLPAIGPYEPTTFIDDSGYIPDVDTFSIPLSTAVLPQLYSSGFVDEMEGHIRNVQSQINQPSQPNQQYLPTHYVNPSPSYATFPSQIAPQMGQYDTLSSHVPMHQHLSHLPHPEGQRQPQQSSQMYQSQQYNAYSRFQSFPLDGWVA